MRPGRDATYGGKEHQRFMLLKDGSELSLGHSLNDLDKNEWARRKAGNARRLFFEEQWRNNVQLKSR